MNTHRYTAPSPVDSTKIVILDDHALFAESLEMTLDLEGFDARRIELDPDQLSSNRLLSKILRMRPRVVLLDLDLGSHGNGIDLIRPLTEAGVVVTVLTSTTDRARWGECIVRGARKVVAKNAPLGELLGAIRRLSNGQAMMSREERAKLIEHWQEQQSVERNILSRLAYLTHREAEVLGMLMSGQQVSDIAKVRFVSESTVRTQVKSVLFKLQVSSQLTAVGLANKANWSAPSSPTRRTRRVCVPGSRMAQTA